MLSEGVNVSGDDCDRAMIPVMQALLITAQAITSRNPLYTKLFGKHITFSFIDFNLASKFLNKKLLSKILVRHFCVSVPL